MICSLTEPGSGRTTGAGKIVASQRCLFGIVPLLRKVGRAQRRPPDTSLWFLVGLAALDPPYDELPALLCDDADCFKQLSILGSSHFLAQ